MNKSLEALEKISYRYVNDPQFQEWCSTIKQDLERLELIEALYNKSLKEMENIKDVDRELYLKYKALEKENQELIVNKNVAQAVALNQKREIDELKDKIAYLQEEFEGWQSAYEWSQAKNTILKLEKQELENTIEKFIEYLDKEPNKAIPKHSIKQTLNKFLKEVLNND